MFSFLKNLSQRFQIIFKFKEKDFHKSITNITGQSPKNINLYRLAVSHTSVAKESDLGVKFSNERLEYLGDAVLGAVVAEFLFKKFPFKDEGFLTEIRSRIVNRESLNVLGKKIGLLKIIDYSGNKNSILSYKSIVGDALEALIGAVYLDLGFKKCKKFIIQRLINPHFDLDEIIKHNKNFKSMLIEWAQKENKSLKFEILKELGSTHFKEFTAQVLLEELEFSTGSGPSKKKAEQAAAEQAWNKIQNSLK